MLPDTALDAETFKFVKKHLLKKPSASLDTALDALVAGLPVDIMERLGPYLEPDAVDAETLTRLRDAVQLIERKTGPRG